MKDFPLSDQMQPVAELRQRVPANWSNMTGEYRLQRTSVVDCDPGEPWRPIAESERYATLDVLRGVALFGVLLVNLETLFRVSLFHHILSFHTDAGRLN